MKQPRSKKAGGFRETRNEFLTRFYRWASADTLGQFREGFPRLKNLKSGPALKYLEFVDNLPKADRLRFVTAKLKQSHDRASVLLGESLSPVEKALLGGFYRGHEVAMPSTSIRAYVSSRVEMALTDLKVSNPSAFNIDKALLRSKVEARLRPLLGESGQQGSHPKATIFNMQNGQWSIITSVDTPRTFQLRYNHSIRHKGRAYLIERTSAFHWMGVCIENYWNYLTSSDLDSTAESVAEMCRVFLDALPKLLKGLDLLSGRLVSDRQ